MNNLVQLHPTAPNSHPTRRPRTTTLLCDDGALLMDPTERTMCEVVPLRVPPAGEPTLFATEGAVVLDLGDSTPDRTLLSLSPEDARAWARALMETADEAEQQGD